MERQHCWGGTFSEEDRYAKREPSGDILGSAFSGLPNSTLWGMRAAAILWSMSHRITGSAVSVTRDHTSLWRGSVLKTKTCIRYRSAIEGPQGRGEGEPRTSEAAIDSS